MEGVEVPPSTPKRLAHRLPWFLLYLRFSRRSLLSSLMCSLGPHPNFKSNLSQRLPRWVPCVRFPHDPRGLPHAFACRFHKAFPGSLLCASPACVPIMFPVLRNASPVRLDAFFGTFIRSFLRTFPVQSVRSTAYPVYSLCFSWTIPSSFPRVLSPFTPTFYVRSSFVPF